MIADDDYAMLYTVNDAKTYGYVITDQCLVLSIDVSQHDDKGLQWLIVANDS